jgi:hypothetical protein
MSESINYKPPCATISVDVIDGEYNEYSFEDCLTPDDPYYPGVNIISQYIFAGFIGITYLFERFLLRMSLSKIRHLYPEMEPIQ